MTTQHGKHEAGNQERAADSTPAPTHIGPADPDSGARPDPHTRPDRDPDPDTASDPDMASDAGRDLDLDTDPVMGAGDGDNAEPPEAAPAAVIADGLSLKGGRGWVFRDVDLRVAPGETVLLVGPAGSGRSCLLLALTGRMAGATGDLTVAGYSLAGSARQVLSHSSVARISDLVVPEPDLTIAESIVERQLLDGARAEGARRRFDAAAGVLGLTADRQALVDDLSAAEQTALAMALAFIAPADVVVLDDVDRGVDAEGLQQLCARMVELAGDGTAIVATAVQPPPDAGGLTVVSLTPAIEGDSR